MAHSFGASVNPQATLIASLLQGRGFPHPVSSCALLETHISWVILSGKFAYKIKKNLRLDFLDFSSLQKRRHFCEEELRLNRRYAPALYLDVVPIGGSVENPVIGGSGDAIEYALRMVQFPQSARLDHQLNEGLLQEDDVYDLAATVAGYHAGATVIEYANERESVRKVRAPMLENFSPLRQVIDMDLLTRVQHWTADSLRQRKPTLIERRKEGFVRDCHGDLHLANLVRADTGIVAFDCVEFSAELRNIDVISDVAFLVMDLVGHARQDLAFVFLNRYLECTGDYRGLELFGLYFVYHCMIRAKVAAIRSSARSESGDREDDIATLKRHLAVAARWIDHSPPKLIAMHGYSGSGKSWVSSRLISQLPAVRLRSDIERKRLHGATETAKLTAAPDQGLYEDKARAAVYEHLLETATHVLDAGFNVILDASFLAASTRRALAMFAAGKAVPLAFVETVADRTELENRLRERATAGVDASDADTPVLDYQYDNAEALDAEERRRTVRVNTKNDIDTDQIIKALRQIQ